MSGSMELNKLEKIPVFIGEGHYQVLPFINRHIDANALPKSGNIIVKLDALPDDVVPKEMLTKTALQPPTLKWTLYSDIGMHNWIRKSAESGNTSHVIWVKPAWSKVACDGNAEKTFEKSDGNTTVTVDIKTVGKALFQNEPDDYEDLSIIASQYISENTPWILDIDLSFFCTINPFVDLYKKANIYPIIEELFAYKLPANNTPEEIQKAAEYREKQLNELEKILMHLEEKNEMPKDVEHTERFKKVEEMKKKLEQHYPEEHIDWKQIFEGGCVCSELQLPVHHTDREKILEMQKDCFTKVLDSFACPPTIITIARSSEYDVFVPIKDCNFIEQNLVKTLQKKLDIDDPEMPYLDQ